MFLVRPRHPFDAQVFQRLGNVAARVLGFDHRVHQSLFGGHVTKGPRDALTMGIGTMLDARSLVLIATGRSKARAVGAMFTGRISTNQPASFLQLHRNVEVILDLAAAEKLPESGFDAEP